MKDNFAVKLDRLRSVLDAYGAQKASWPADEKDELAEFVKSSQEAQQLLANARTLDDLLGSHSNELKASSSLLGAVLQDAANLQKKSTWSLDRLTRIFLKPASGLILAACLGVFVGISSPNILITADEINLDELSVSDTVLDWELENGNG